MYFCIAYPNQLLEASQSYKDVKESFDQCRTESKIVKQIGSKLIEVISKHSTAIRQERNPS